MITALLLIFDASRTWEKIGSSPDQRVGRVFFAYLFPILLLSIVGESLGLLKFGMYEGEMMPRLVKPSQELVIRYQAVQTLLDYLEAGESIDEFLAGFPSVTRQQVIDFLEAAKDRLVESVE